MLYPVYKAVHPIKNMSAVHQNMKQLESHWRDLQQKNLKETTSKKRSRTEDNVRTVKNRTEIQQNRKIVKIIRK